MLAGTSAHVEDAFSRKLRNFAALSTADEAAIALFLARGTARAFLPADEVKPGSRRSYSILMEGFAYRYVYLPEGHRQILSFILPGDFIAPFSTAWEGGCLYQVRTATHTIFKAFDLAADPRVDLGATAGIAAGIVKVRQQEENLLHQRMADIGHRPAEARVSALLCELYYRLRAVGLNRGNVVRLPLSQEEIGDAVGITTVHTNRIFQRLRRGGLIVWHGGELQVLDLAGLRATAFWDPAYLLYRNMPEPELA